MDSTAAVPQPSLIDHRPDACEVLLIRHGRSADVVPGSPESIDPGLHPHGEAQVAALAERLSEKRSTPSTPPTSGGRSSPPRRWPNPAA